MVLAGDVPLVEAELLPSSPSAHERAGAAATVVTTVLEDPRGYGRIVRDARRRGRAHRRDEGRGRRDSRRSSRSAR